jgi:4-amino-4-deoxy-L-arabinose transferase-like glycosyltransferase
LLVIPLVTAWWGPQPREEAHHATIRRLLWWWIVVIVGVFSLSRTKQDLYIFPVVPAVAALVADTLVSSDYGRRHRGVRAILLLVAALCICAGGLVFALFRSGAYALGGSTMASLLLVAGGSVGLVALMTARERMAVLTLAVTFVLFNYVFVSMILPSLERFKPTPAFAAVIADRGEPTDRVASYDYMLPSLVFYARRPVRELYAHEDVVEFFGVGYGWAMMRSDERAAALLRDVPDLCVAARSPVFDARLGTLIAGRPPDEVLLVTNRCGSMRGQILN